MSCWLHWARTFSMYCSSLQPETSSLFQADLHYLLSVLKDWIIHPLMKPPMVRVLLKCSFLSCNPRCSLVHAISLLTALSYSFLSAILTLLRGHCTSLQWPLPVSSFDLCSFTQQRRFSNSSVLLCLHLGFWACQVWIHHCKTHEPFSTLASVQTCSMTRMETTLLMNVRFGNTPSAPLSWREGPPF